MLTEERKRELKEIAENYMALTDLNRLIINTNVSVLLASQEAQEKMKELAAG